MLLLETNGHRTSKSGHRTVISGHRTLKTGHRNSMLHIPLKTIKDIDSFSFEKSISFLSVSFLRFWRISVPGMMTVVAD